MNASLSEALNSPRILMEAALKPVQGSRFQPTGFPNLGAAEFRESDGTTSILVESAQSMANRLEEVAWDEATNDLVTPLQGLPYVLTRVGDRQTDSIREAHRLNSPYLYRGIATALQERAGVAAKKKKNADEDGQSSGVDIRKLAAAVLYFDPNSILHGIFLPDLSGAARLTRIVSAFIEASDTNAAESGGVKNDRVDPVGAQFGGAVKGFGNVPFARTEYTAKSITGYFSIDVALLKSYGLGDDAEELLAALALWKIQRFLEIGGRLRTACDLEPIEVKVTRPKDWRIPSLADLENVLCDAIRRCTSAGLFADPAKTVVEFPQK